MSLRIEHSWLRGCSSGDGYVKTLPDVVFATRNLYTCADDGLTSIKESIKEHNLNRWSSRHARLEPTPPYSKGLARRQD